MNKFAFVCCIFLATLLCLSSILSCKKDPETITDTYIETDTLVVTQQGTIFINATDAVNLTHFVHDTATTFILVRHAEAESFGPDPNLIMEGIARVEQLQKALESLQLTGVYSTDFNRTTQTAQPVAEDQSLPLEFYNASDLDPLVDGILENHLERTVLVVGHSNSTPSLLNILTGENTYSNFMESEYDNLFVVTVFEKGHSEVVHMTYGE